MDYIYFDNASTTAVDPEVITVMEPYFHDHYGNVSSPHTVGQTAHKAFEDARETCARFIGARPEEIIFNAGATESNNHAIFGIARNHQNKGKHIIVSSIEHHSVLEPIEYLQNQEGYRVTYLKVDEDGLVDPKDVKDAICDETVLVAVMLANNEIGTIEPISDIGTITRQHNIPFLVDACQAVGHIPVNVDELNADLLSFSAHKFYGPKGAGALYRRKGIEVSKFLLGGSQEQGQRASTQNVAGIVGMAHALKLCEKTMSDEAKMQTRLRGKLLTEVPKIIDGVKINGSLEQRLPNNAHFSFDRVQGESLLMSLDMAHIGASMGSACAAGAMEPSHVLRAIGLSDEMAYGALRLSLGRWNTEEQVDYFLDKLPSIIESLRT